MKSKHKIVWDNGKDFRVIIKRVRHGVWAVYYGFVGAKASWNGTKKECLKVARQSWREANS